MSRPTLECGSTLRHIRGKVNALIAATSLGLCAIGLVTVTQGVTVPVTATVGQQDLEKDFEAQFSAHRQVLADPMQKAASGPMAGTSALVRQELPHPQSVARPATRGTSALPTRGPIARLTVQRLGVRTIIVPSDGTEEQMKHGPAMLKRGEGANPVTIVAAHRDTHFLFIRDLHPGDEIAMELVNGQIELYRVTRLETVRWDKFAYPLDPARPLLALATCYPFGGTEYGGPWRRVAWAERVS